MPVNWLQIAYIVAINTALGAVVTLLFVKLGLPKLLSKAEIWMGGAIGRFMQNLAKQAEDEEGGEGGSTPAGALNIAGFKIDAGTIRSIAEILKVVQSLGLLKGVGGSGTGGEHPFLK